jgi:hypothetical protein
VGHGPPQDSAQESPIFDFLLKKSVSPQLRSSDYDNRNIASLNSHKSPILLLQSVATAYEGKN